MMLMVSGCNTTDSNGVQKSGTMQATVAGAAWSAAYLPGVSSAAVGVYSDSTGLLTITGSSIDLSGNTETLALILLHPRVRTDTLGLGSTGTFSYGKPGESSYVTIGPNAGIATITKYDTVNHLISGTFHFNAVQANNLSNSISVTNGSFIDIAWTRR